MLKWLWTWDTITDSEVSKWFNLQEKKQKVQICFLAHSRIDKLEILKISSNYSSNILSSKELFKKLFRDSTIIFFMFSSSFFVRILIYSESEIPLQCIIWLVEGAWRSSRENGIDWVSIFLTKFIIYTELFSLTLVIRTKYSRNFQVLCLFIKWY